MKYTLVEGYNFHFNFQPQTLNPLIMYTSSGDHATPVDTSLGML